jgi:hypothetical protein
MRRLNSLNSACAVAVEASCGGSYVPDRPIRGLCRRAPRIPLAAPDGGPVCSPVMRPRSVTSFRAGFHSGSPKCAHCQQESLVVPDKLGTSNRSVARLGRDCSQGCRQASAARQVPQGCLEGPASRYVPQRSLRSPPGFWASGPAPAALITTARRSRATCLDRRWEPGDLGSSGAERGGFARESAAVY